MDGQERNTLTDAALDGELDTALRVDPSPEFLARVRTRIASEPLPSPWRPRLWLAGAAAAVVTVAAAIGPWPARERVEPQQAAAPTAPVHGRVATEGPAPAPVAPVQEDSREESQPRRRAALHAPARTMAARVEPQVDRPPFPEVLISEKEVQAYHTYVAAVQQRRVPPMQVAESTASSLDEPLRDLDVAPIVIDPLPQIARLEIGEIQ